MNRRKSLAALGILVLAIVAFAFVKAQTISSIAPTQHARTQPPDLPDDILYRHLFRHVVALKAKAEEFDKQGKDAHHLRTHFKRKANLNDSQAQMFDEIAAQCALEMKPVDEHAKLIIAAYRAQYPNGQVPRGEKPLPPPIELKSLSAQRDAIVLRARDRLRAVFGDDEFNRFHNEYVKHHVAPNIQTSSSAR